MAAACEPPRTGDSIKWMSMPGYAELQVALGGLGDGPAAAEAHGTLCGLLCAGVSNLPEGWIHDTLADAEEYSFGGRDDARSMLESLYGSTAAALAEDGMTFHLLLPGDEAGLGERAAALGAWCGGFLFGLAVRGLKPVAELPQELQEILSDLSEISRAGVAEEEAEEEGEAAYAELVEYVRVAVQIVFESGRGAHAESSRPQLS
jgi:uncharacterized protein